MFWLCTINLLKIMFYFIGLHSADIKNESLNFSIKDFFLPRRCYIPQKIVIPNSDLAKDDIALIYRKWTVHH